MNSKEYEYRQKQNKYRREYEKKGHVVIEEALKKYYPQRIFNITYTPGDWDVTDIIINGKRVEYKARWWKTQEEVDRFKNNGFLLQADKLLNNDVFFYYIEYTKELYMISTKNLNKLINDGKIKITTTTVNKYQFVPEAGKQQVVNYIVPVELFDKCFQL